MLLERAGDLMKRLELIQTFADSVEQERLRLGLTQKQMAQALDLSLSAYKRMITCSIDKIDLYVAYKLYQLTGKLAYEYLGLSDPKLDLKTKINSLTPAQLTYVDAIVEFEKNFARQCSDAEDYITVYIPTGNMEDGMVYDSANYEKINIGTYRKKYGDMISCGIRITSNHLHPVYNKGDILLISRSTIRDGDTGVFINIEKGRAYIRKFHQTSPCRLEPVNDCGETFYVDSHNKEEMDQWIKFGKVIAKIR